MTVAIYHFKVGGYGAEVFCNGKPLALAAHRHRHPELVAASVLAHYFGLGAEERLAIEDGRVTTTAAGRKVERLARDLALTISSKRESFTWTNEELDDYVQLAPSGWCPGDLAWIKGANHWEAGNIEAVTRTRKATTIEAHSPSNSGRIMTVTLGAGCLRHRDKAKRGDDRPRKDPNQ